MSQAEKLTGWILKGGLLLTPFIVLMVTRSLYFPFITGKNFAFRILVELLGAAWVWAAFRFPRFRPYPSAVVWAVLSFLAVMGLATLFALSPYHSFWSNFERMEGYLGLLHLALYFLILASVFTAERDWKVFFHTSLAASVIVSLYGVFQLLGKLVIHQGRTRIDATFGNATYFAAYLLFHLFFLLWFLLRSPSRPARLAYGAVFLLEALMLYYTATRGAILGFLGGLVVLGILLAVLGGGHARRWALAGLGAALALPILFFLVRGAEFVKRSPVLDRFASISLQETTTQSRFTIWKMALKGWSERPILGWGQESFVYVFSRHYEPSLWRQEPWFDRAHNVFLDWLIAGGILGLAGYLAMFAAAGWALLRSFRAGAMDAVTLSVLVGLLAAYFFQNLFVFDNLTSYLLFFALLAYLHAMAGQPASAAAGRYVPPVSRRGRRQANAMPMVSAAAAAAVASVGVLALLYFANTKPILAAKSILDGISAANFHPPAGRVDAMLAAFRKGIALNTFGTTEVREQASEAVPLLLRDPAVAAQDRAKFVAFAVEELERQRVASPTDMRAKAFLATLYSTAGRSQEAIALVDEALAVSDRRPQFYFIAAEAYVQAGQAERAIQVLRRARDLDPSYPEATANLAVVLILSGRGEEAETLLQGQFGSRWVHDERYAKAYAQIGRLERAIAIQELRLAENPDSARVHAQLGVLYGRIGRRAEAIRELERAMALDPTFRAEGEQLIQAIQAGQLR